MTEKIQYKFSLSGREVSTGKPAEEMFVRTMAANTPAGLINTYWNDNTMRGSITIVLAQIAAKFELSNVPVKDMLFIQKHFMHEERKPNSICAALYEAMRAQRSQTLKGEPAAAEPRRAAIQPIRNHRLTRG